MIISKKRETQEMFNKNLQLLPPWLKEAMLKIGEDELWKKIEIAYNDEGYPICRYNQGNKSFNITSERPIQEAQRWYKTISVQGTGAVFLFGTGFGYSLFEVFAHKQPHTLVVVFEQDLYLFKAMLYYFDLEPIIKTQKLLFLLATAQILPKALTNCFSAFILSAVLFPLLHLLTLQSEILKRNTLKFINMFLHNYHYLFFILEMTTKII